MVREMAYMKRCKLWKTGEDGLCCSSSAIQTRLGPSSLLEERSEIPILFRQNTYLQNKKHTLTCQGGTGCYRFNYQPGSQLEGVGDTPPSTAAQLSFFAQPRLSEDLSLRGGLL